MQPFNAGLNATMPKLHAPGPSDIGSSMLSGCLSHLRAQDSHMNATSYGLSCEDVCFDPTTFNVMQQDSSWTWLHETPIHVCKHRERTSHACEPADQ